MEVLDTLLPGVRVIAPRVFGDARGFFLETFNRDRFGEHGLPTDFVQDNRSRSFRGVLRGLHYQLENPQGKLVTAVTGEIFDVAVDIRRGSATFGRWFGVRLREHEPRFLWIPPGFAHGFCVLSDYADVVYKCTAPYNAKDERGVRWNDPAIGVEWPIEKPFLSVRDESQPLLSEAGSALPRFVHA